MELFDFGLLGEAIEVLSTKCEKVQFNVSADCARNVSNPRDQLSSIQILNSSQNKMNFSFESFIKSSA